MKDIGLYLHIPFCKSKCYYCDFNSYSNKESIQEEYVDCLMKEIDLRSSTLEGYRIKSIYIGGGTPTYLNLDVFDKLLSYLNKYVCKDIEYTIEANPGTLTYERLSLLKDKGVNRLSMGLQSWDDNILKILGRIHTVEDFIQNYHMARDIGFNNINIDIMFSIQGQTIEGFENTLDNVISLNPEHISCYSLIIEEGTPFYQQFKEGKLKEVDEDTDREMYYLAVNKLKNSGYFRYEISNYSKRGYECLHNIIYWRTEEYIGIGAGAHSYIDGVRFSNITSPEQYINMIKNNNLPVSLSETLSKDDKISEYMFMGLRMAEGVSFQDFNNRFNRELLSVYGNEIDKLIKNNLIKINRGRLMLTDKGIDLSNRVFVEFLN